MAVDDLWVVCPTRIGLAFACCVLAGCAVYHPKELADRPDLAPGLPHVAISPARLRPPGVRLAEFDPAQGLTADGAAIIAVLNNPDLRAYRRRAGVAQAQLFAAGLLPDPQIAITTLAPITGPFTSNAFAGGLVYAFDQLVRRGPTLAAAQANVRSVDLDVLWQEWQVAQNARIQFVKLWFDERERGLLRQYRALYAAAYRRSERALAQGNTTLDVTGTDLVALLDADTRLNTLEQQLNTERHQLNELLGVIPSLALPLSPDVASATVHVPSASSIRAALQRMPERRPDLLALKAGYQSQEAKLRAAILGQFPPLSIGVNRGHDVTQVYAWGVDVTLGLPIFNGNRGNVAIERATREQLRSEYQARLDKAYGTADQLRIAAQVIGAALAKVGRELPDIERTAANARAAFQAHDIPAATYLALQVAALNERIEALTLERSLGETAIGLETLLGEPIAAEAAHLS